SYVSEVGIKILQQNLLLIKWKKLKTYQNNKIGNKMKKIENIKEKKLELRYHQNKQIGFVITKGFLHNEHLSLVEDSVKKNDLTVLIIFVNPIQFGPNEDFETYPRDAKRDASLAESHGVDIIFIPTSKVMYPEKMTFAIEVTEKADVLCGKN